jgi:hypothetical protein
MILPFNLYIEYPGEQSAAGCPIVIEVRPENRFGFFGVSHR